MPDEASFDGLLPTAGTAGKIRFESELPKEAWAWGRIIDVSDLEPGDLPLFRTLEEHSDAVSRAIVETQRKTFAPRHAQWTHAAVYLGDGEHICEANFKVPNVPHGVNIKYPVAVLLLRWQACNSSAATCWFRCQTTIEDRHRFSLQYRKRLCLSANLGTCGPSRRQETLVAEAAACAR
jgi:hypothetical protein